LLSPRYLSTEQLQWNQKWGAPFGYNHADRIRNLSAVPRNQRFRLAGPFAFQANNTTRHHEYPWVYSQIDHNQSRAIIDVGAGLTGMQFVLSKIGHRLYCVDPGLADGAAYGWGSTPITHADLNAAFHTDVTPFPVRLEDTGFTDSSIDYVTCVSTIEHIPFEGACSLLEKAGQLLRPGGRFVATIDLFLNLEPWTRKTQNKWGTNLNVFELLKAAPDLELVVGEPSQLYGFPEFDPDAILEDLEKYYIGEYPCFAQCIALERR
jgi:SAM-dependent methyltransferase